MKFSSTEPKFDISIKNITGKNTFLNSKYTFLYFARLFRPWVISARAVLAPELFFICGSFYPESKTWQTKTNKFQGSFFLFIYFKDRKHSSECHSIKNTFFLKN